MSTTFILHDYKTNKNIEVGFIRFQSESSTSESGTHVWWLDELGNKKSAFVRESFEKIDEIMKSALKSGK